jgi:methionyl-tRNA formyltransferase
MPGKVWVIGTFDQPSEALFDVDLMRWLASAGVPVAGIMFKRSRDDQNPRASIASTATGTARAVLHVRGFNDQFAVSHLRTFEPDLLVYAGGRDILRPPLLDAAPLGCIGGHYGRLPQIRGMGTVEWSVIRGMPPTVAIQRIGPGIDTGDILLQARVPLVAGDTFTSIRDRSYFLTKTMLALAARRLLDGELAGAPQELDAGRQHYRLHPVLQRHAERALERLLAARDRSRGTEPGNREQETPEPRNQEPKNPEQNPRTGNRDPGTRELR